MESETSSPFVSKTPKSNTIIPQYDPQLSPTTGSKPRYARVFTRATLKSVFLHDWWLVKPDEGKGLAVGGLSSRENFGVRMFSSAAIAKRISATELVTTDGVTITINGCLNRSRTLQNGFQLEVCKHFLIGFPYYWEDVAQSSSENLTKRTTLSRIPSLVNVHFNSGSKHFVPSSSDDLPATTLYAILMSPSGATNDAQSKTSGNATSGSSRPVNPNVSIKSPDKNTSVTQEEAGSDLKDKQKHNRAVGRSCKENAVRNQFTKGPSESPTCSNVVTSSVVRRSSRVKKPKYLTLSRMG